MKDDEKYQKYLEWRASCPDCHGTGEVSRYMNGGFEYKITCPRCGPDDL